MHVQFCTVGSLEKVLADEAPQALSPGTELTALRGETVSVQIAYRTDDFPDGNLFFEALAGRGVGVRLRRVELSPVRFPGGAPDDWGYLTHKPGMLPDLLSQLPAGGVRPVRYQWRSIWADLEIDEDCAPGAREVTLRACDADGAECWRETLTLRVAGAALGAQRLLHTEWFHGDCLADYYGVPVFSEEHWEILGRFLACAAKRGMNMILTPVFTPPLDTAEGGERTTIQLVGIERDGERYVFDFDKLQRWIALCRACGIRYFEIAHFFTQWGARHAPKIVAGAEQRRIFGWETDACGASYQAFLHQFIPALTDFLRAQDVYEKTWFHISDEPSSGHEESYSAARASIIELLPQERVIDALSSFEYYERGLVTRPIVSNDHIEPFLAAKVPDLWTYYCVSQSKLVSNRFMSMPSWRNRILGVQLYLYRIQGFLHWGYNFYNTQFSVSHINPFAETDSGEIFPSGDPFLVYPGEGGEPLESIRGMVLYAALCDVRALELLESLTGRAHVEELIAEEAGAPITFSRYPEGAAFLTRLRDRVNREIESRC